jgi:hypothetical protein
VSQLLASGSVALVDQSGAAAVRVVSVPAGHPYVRRVTASAHVEVLPDPQPAGVPPGQWWPPAALDADWIRRHKADADLLHIHFGTESFSDERLRSAIAAAKAAGWPVVFTVHDLVHPQLRDQAPYERQLDILVPAADALVTLTPGAADEIEHRWGRRALVMPHPSLLAKSRIDLGGTPRADEFRVATHLKDLRSNVAAESTVVALVAAAEILAATGVGIVAEVRMHRSVGSSPLRERIRELCAASERITLVEHDRLDDTALAAALAAVDACILPYGYGTHSGWLELCWDLAVPVVVPQVGFYAEQHVDDSVVSFAPDPGGFPLASALRSIAESASVTRSATSGRAAEMVRRRAQRVRVDDEVSAAHAELYRQLVDERRA